MVYRVMSKDIIYTLNVQDSKVAQYVAKMWLVEVSTLLSWHLLEGGL